MTDLPSEESQKERGWEASLRLGYIQKSGKTVLSENHHSGPLRVQRPLYPEDDVCHTCILHPPGGVVGGDSLSVSLKVGDDGHALITTPGATKFYRSANRLARQHQLLEVREGILEWFPQENIIFPGAEAEISTKVELHGQAQFLGWELLCLGLPTQNELFDRGRVQSNLTLRRDGRPLFVERLRVTEKNDLLGPTSLRGYPVTANFVATGANRTMVEELRELMPECGKSFVGITLMGELLVARYLGDSTVQAREIFQQLWVALRPQLLGRSACIPRIWST